MTNRIKQHVFWLFMCMSVAGMFVHGPAVYAQGTSPNYKVNETIFGTGGEVDAVSNQYRSLQSTGSLGVGNASSDNYDSVLGLVTPNEPFLEMAMYSEGFDLGALDAEGPTYSAAQGGACNCTFSVRTYLSSEYTVLTVSQPPTNESGAVLDAKSFLDFASTNTSVEEFGMNLVANALPGAMGANPVNEPDGTFGNGQAATGYDTPDKYKYAVGDVVARSPAVTGNPAVGRTNYTISYIAKHSIMTEAGFYSMNHELVAVPTF